MNILWDSGNVGFGGCGINEWDRQIVTCLRRAGHEVTIIVDDNLRRRPRFKTWKPPEGGYTEYSGKIFPDTYREVVDSLGSFDVQIGNHFTMFPVLDNVIPVCHDFDIGTGLDPTSRLRLTATGLSRIAKGFLCTTPYIQSYFDKHLPEVITTCLLGGTKLTKKEVATSGAPYIAYWGNRYDSNKNFLSLLKTLKYHNYDLKVSGFQEPREKELELVESLGIQDRVTFFTGLDDDALAEMVSGAALYVCPSKHEGFGLPTVEAMSLGVPVVSTPYGALLYVVGDCGRITKSGSVKDLVAEIKKVEEDPKQTQILVERGLKRAKQWTWESAAKKLVVFCESLLSS